MEKDGLQALFRAYGNICEGMGAMLALGVSDEDKQEYLSICNDQKKWLEDHLVHGNPLDFAKFEFSTDRSRAVFIEATKHIKDLRHHGESVQNQALQHDGP